MDSIDIGLQATQIKDQNKKFVKEIRREATNLKNRLSSIHQVRSSSKNKAGKKGIKVLIFTFPLWFVLAGLSVCKKDTQRVSTSASNTSVPCSAEHKDSADMEESR